MKKQQKVKGQYRLPRSLKKAFADKCKKQGVWQTDVIEALISKWTRRN